MPALHVRNVDDAVVERLKARAARHHRSLEGELRAILAEAARDTSAGVGPAPLRLRLRTVDVGTKSDFGRDEIYGDDGR